MITDGEGARFIIATHSTIIISFPGVQIFYFDEDDFVSVVDYEELEHVGLYKRFLANLQKYLRNLFSE